MTDKTGGPAFPFGQVSETTGAPINGYHNDGMTLRDYFAAKALPSIIKQCAFDTRQPNESIEQYFSRRAYNLADAMIAERTKS